MKKACRALLGLTLSIVLIGAEPLNAKDRPWFRYENNYFEAFSDSSERKVRTLLEELENFRAAADQILSFDIPDGAVKTQVIIFNSKKQFRDVAGSDSVDAFAAVIDSVPYIVMSSSGPGRIAKIAIRHEYIHILLAYSRHTFPPWYQEGIAEFMSGTEFKNRGKKFTVGMPIGRTQTRAALFPWEALTAGDFQFHSIDSQMKGSNAYFQAWLLVHYLMIGDDFAYNEDLGIYLGYFDSGVSSDQAFQRVFNQSASELAEAALKAYRRGAPYYQPDFEPGNQDHDFPRSGMAAADASELIDILRSGLNWD